MYMYRHMILKGKHMSGCFESADSSAITHVVAREPTLPSWSIICKSVIKSTAVHISKLLHVVECWLFSMSPFASFTWVHFMSGEVTHYLHKCRLYCCKWFIIKQLFPLYNVMWYEFSVLGLWLESMANKKWWWAKPECKCTILDRCFVALYQPHKKESGFFWTYFSSPNLKFLQKMWWYYYYY